MMEIAVLLNYIILFLLRFPQPLLDELVDYSDTAVPTVGADQHLPGDHYKLTWFFVPIFYFPLVMSIGVVGLWIFHKLKTR